MYLGSHAYGGPHAYELISLMTTGLCVAFYLVVAHLLMIVKPHKTAKFLKGVHRNHLAGTVVLAIAMAWFWLLIAPEDMGALSSLTMDLGEFNGFKPILRVAVPVVAFLVATQVREFLFVRALGILMLMVASPILESAFLKEPSSRLLLSFFAYGLIVKGLFFVGTPYMFRDLVSWATESIERYRGMALVGLVYGIAVLICSVTVWSKY